MKAIKVMKPSYILEISEDEARVLRSILGNVGGLPGGPRDVVNDLSAALDSVGVTPYYDHLKGTTYLPNNWEGYDNNGN